LKARSFATSVGDERSAHMPLKAGDLVYRVIEIDPPGEGRHTWKVASVVVTSASTKQIKLKTYFSGLYRVLYEPNALNRVFFETQSAAIQGFLDSRRQEIVSLDRHRAEADRAIAWAVAQEGVVP
jgi:hypothetical protein